MRTRNGFLLAVTITSTSFLLLAIGTLSAKADKPDPHKPVPASDIALVKKMSVQGRRPANVGGTKKRYSATGVLGAECGGNRYAIVVGISNYPGTVNDLLFADDDALLMAHILEETYGFDNITTLIDGGATRVSVLDAIDEVKGLAGPADEVVFFYSGHGMSGNAMDGDAERMDEAIVVNPVYKPNEPFLDLEPLWDGELANAFSDFDTSRIVFIFDMCMAGGMDDLQESGRVILMASGERSYAWEGDEWAYGDNLGNGEFTYYLARGILDGEARIYNYYGTDLAWIEPVTVEAAFDYAKANCEEDRPVIADGFPDDLLP